MSRIVIMKRKYVAVINSGYVKVHQVQVIKINNKHKSLRLNNVKVKQYQRKLNNLKQLKGTKITYLVKEGD